jgi:hypothetical protein
MNTTAYAIRFAKIWNTAEDRRHAHRNISEELDSDMTYKHMMGKVKYMRMRGVDLCDLHPAYGVDWEEVRSKINC